MAGKQLHWTKQRVFEEAKKYTTKTDFFENCWSGYLVAQRNGWLAEMNWFVRKPYAKKQREWDKDSALEFAKTCKTVDELLRKNKYAYYFLKDNDLFDQVKWLKKTKCGRKVKWTKFKIKLEAKKYSNITEFSKKNYSAYSRASKLNLVNDICNRKYNKWTYANLESAAKKYKTKHDLRVNDACAYEAMRIRGLLDVFYKKDKKECQKSRYKKWSYEQMESVAKNYKTKHDLYVNDKNAYEAIRRNHLLDKFFSNEQKYKSKWSYEKMKEHAEKWSSSSELRLNDKRAYYAISRNRLLKTFYK